MGGGGGGEEFALVRNSNANVGMENFSSGGKCKTSFTILGFSLSTQIGKILVAAICKLKTKIPRNRYF